MVLKKEKRLIGVHVVFGERGKKSLRSGQKELVFIFMFSVESRQGKKKLAQFCYKGSAVRELIDSLSLSRRSTRKNGKY